MTVRHLSLALVIALLPARDLGAQSRTEFTIIINTANTVASLTRLELSRLFLKQRTQWSDRRIAQPADLTEDSGAREAFSRRVHKKPVRLIKAYWQQQFFSGAGVPPPEFSTDAEVIAFVRARPGGLGYVSAAADLTGVKVLTVVE